MNIDHYTQNQGFSFEDKVYLGLSNYQGPTLGEQSSSFSVHSIKESKFKDCYSFQMMQETTLHAQLKAIYTQPGDLVEQYLNGYRIDILRGELVIEIQTQKFSALATKLMRLSESHPILLVYPIPSMKWIVYVSPADSQLLHRRKSPRHLKVEHVFEELVHIPSLLNIPNISLDLLLIDEEELRKDDGKGSWRRKGVSLIDRRLIEIGDQRHFESFQALAATFLDIRPGAFSSQDLADSFDVPISLARKMVYCMQKMNLIQICGKRNRYNLYQLSDILEDSE